MSNENKKQINEEESLSPTVLAVVNALNGSNGSDIGRVTRMIDASKISTIPVVQNASSLNEEAEVEYNEELEELFVDIYEENGHIVEIDNVVVFYDDPLPGIETIEKFRGVEYANGLINEADLQPVKIQSKKKAAPAPVKKAAPAPAKIGQKVSGSKLDPKTGKAIAPAPAPTKKAGPVQKAPVGKAKPSDLEPVTIKSKKTTDLEPVTIKSKKTTDTDFLQPVKIKSKKTTDLEPVTIKSKKKPVAPSEDDLEPVQIKSKRPTPSEDDLEPVQIKSKKVPPPAPKDQSTGGYTGAGNAGTIGDDEEDQTDTGSADGIKINYKIGSASSKNIGKQAYLAKQQSGEIGKKSQVVFNLKDVNTGERTRSIKPGDPEYQDFYNRYKKIKGAVTEALIRAGAVLTEEGWYLNDELVENVELDYVAPEMSTQYYYDTYGNLRMMTDSDFAELSLAEAVVEMQLAQQIDEELDEVGGEDEDVDNDGDSDKSDDYLKNRREAVSKAIQKKTMKEESSEEETEVEQVEEEVQQIAPAQRTNWPWRK